MADHRVTDLSYGHLGKASYDPEEKEWRFSVNLEQEPSIQQLLPFKQWLPPAIREIPESKEIPSRVLRSQRTWLSKTRPELFPAAGLAANLSKLDFSENSQATPHTGSLLAVGHAMDPDRVSGARATRILAVPYGDAGHILRLIKPRAETRGWGKRSAARLAMLDSDSPEYGHWIGKGGAIRQILVVGNEDGPGNWLAVRQDTATTIFRPQYGRLSDAAPISEGCLEQFPISQLNPNPVATLTTEHTQSRLHVDVAINPWYPRQFAVVDSDGIWSIWEIDKPHGKKLAQLLVPGKRGGIYDDYEPGPSSKASDQSHFDGWYKLFWVCNLNTIIVCNRRRFTLVDLNTRESRLCGEDVVLPNSQDWILDIQRSSDTNHIYVLTTSRVYIIRITPIGAHNEDSKDLEAKIILSYHHFRSPDDESMKLVVLGDRDISVLITSASSPLVQFFCFQEDPELAAISSSSQGSFALTASGEDAGSSCPHTCFLPCSLTPSTSASSSAQGSQYLEHDVRFFQVWKLSINLGLDCSLYAITSQNARSRSSSSPVTAPMHQVRQSKRRFGARYIDEPFVVPDGSEDEDLDESETVGKQHNMQAIMLDDSGNDRYCLDWGRAYRRVFTLYLGPAQRIPAGSITFPDGFSRVLDLIQSGLEDNELATKTITEIAGLKTTSDDLGEASQSLVQFLHSLEPNADSGSTSRVVLSNLLSPEERELWGFHDAQYPEVSTVYDKMVDYWMTGLPLSVPASARVARYRVIHQLAIDLCLSSIGVSIENKPVSSTEPAAEAADKPSSIPVLDRFNHLSRESSPALFSSQLAAIPSQQQDYRLPTPAKTPSLYSHATSASELKEESAITRLRQYVVSVKARPDLGSASVLSHWPSYSGTDPANYSYSEATKAAAAAESGDEGRPSNRKEEVRRRRRTERFLRQERSRAVESAARTIGTPSGSQPATRTHHAVSSQLVSSQPSMGDDLPMTQPVMGAFGSRSAQQGKRKSKKPRTAGFR